MQKIIVFFVGISLCAVVDTINAKQLKKLATSAPVTRVQTMQPVVNPIVAQPVIQPIAQPQMVPIVRELDAQLKLPIGSGWDERVDDLLLDLAAVDRELARDYSQKIRQKRASVVSRPSGIVVEKPGVVPVETGPEVSPLQPGEEPMKKGGRSAPPKKGAPSGGPAKQLGVPKAAPTQPAEKVVAPKKQVFSGPQLKKLDDAKLRDLFKDLLENLSLLTNWDDRVIEKVEEKTKYGSKIYNVYGAPVPKWSNDINTLKTVLVSKAIMPEQEVAKKIADRISEVRAEKTAKPPVVSAQEEKPKEELSEQDLIKMIKYLLAEPKKGEIGWVVSTKGNIKALDKLNHAEALKYHDKFVEITGERRFLQP